MADVDDAEATNAEVKRRIADARQCDAWSLDLGDLKLTALPQEITSLTSLNSLSLGKNQQLSTGKRGKHAANRPNQDELQEISSLASLTDLYSLNLSSCSRLTNLAPLANLVRLQHLDLSNCKSLEGISDLSDLTELKFLSLSGCDQMTDVSHLAHLAQLQTLDLTGCKCLIGLSVLAHLSDLRTIILKRCENIANLSRLRALKKLRSLDLSGCRQLPALPGLTELKHLQTLNLRSCSGLKDFAALSHLTDLRSLDLSWCHLENLSALSGLTKLHSLNLRGCRQLTTLRGIEEMTELRSIDLSMCGSLTDVSALSRLTRLQSLDLRDCADLHVLPSLDALTRMQRLDLRGCYGLTEIPVLAGSMRSLNLSNLGSLTKIPNLSRLSQLQSVSLEDCRELIDLAGLKGLRQLKSLNLQGCTSLRNVNGLVGLDQLEWLDLSNCCDLDNLSISAMPPSIRCLTLSGCTLLDDSLNLTKFTSLEILDLSNCESLSELSGLERLTQLQSLNLRGCSQLKKAPGVATLESLQSLNLSGCRGLATGSFGRSPKIFSDISKLTQLTLLDLSDWNAVTNLSALSPLTNVRVLTLRGCSKLIDITPLTGFRDLEILNLSECVELRDVSPIAELPCLYSLNIVDCKSITRFEPLVPLLSSLTTLSFQSCAFDDLPIEVYAAALNGDPSPLISHYRDLQYGELRDTELKVCVLGNGGVGKTQMCRRLSKQPYDPSVPTTHGIELGHIIQQIDGHPVRLNLWDFGGQDIYHGSHALFVQGHAVFVILWTPDRESGSYVDGATMQHHPLPYWLDFVKGLAGAECPVLVVQSQCDNEDDGLPHVELPHDFQSLQNLHFSARTDLGLDQLQGALAEAARELLDKRPAPLIGKGRAEVRDQLRQMLVKDQKRSPKKRTLHTLSLDQFRDLCRKNGKVSDPESLLEYLYNCGIVIYIRRIFSDTIIVDRNWALQAIYTLFDRQRTLPVFNRHGRFTRRELELLVWQMHSPKDQELFLRMMENCGICFHVRNVIGADGKAEREYLAPELLPEWSTAQEWLLGRMTGGRNEGVVKVHYRFLHEGILRGFLSALGRQAGDAALYWKYGCWFYESTTQSQILVRAEVDSSSGKGTITLRAVGEQSRQLLETVLNLLVGLEIGQPPVVEASWGPGDSADPQIQGDWVAESGDIEDLPKLMVPERPSIPAAKNTAIYVSYAWGDINANEQHRADLDGLCSMIESWGYQVLRDDRVLRPGDWISTFMKAIGRGDHVIVILSDHYLRSHYCMTELFYVYSRSLGEKEEFLKRIIPLIMDSATAVIRDWRKRRDCARSWEAEFKDMEEDLSVLGQADLKQYRLIKQWHGIVGDILGFISDTLTPHGFEQIAKDDYAAVRQMLPSL